VNYGLALLRTRKVEEGVAELERVQKADPSIPHTWFNLGVTHKKNGDYPRAIAQFRRMAELVPNEPITHFNLGVLYRYTGKTDDPGVRDRGSWIQTSLRRADRYIPGSRAYAGSRRRAQAVLVSNSARP
jgi:tetratricopeptide (TPR) repeat protein